MQVKDFWKNIAANFKACFIETSLAGLRSYENTVNDTQFLHIIDSLNSDCVQYFQKHYPLPKPEFKLPLELEQKRQKLILTESSKKINICIYGYNAYSKLIIESFRDDKYLNVSLVTKSVIERLRAEIDGKMPLFELQEVLSNTDFWILVTPYDQVTDFKNSTEENLEFITCAEPIFNQKELLNLKNGCYIANVCNLSQSLDLCGSLEQLP